MSIKKFNKKTISEINYYVYRLVDPRSGLTFYVGKGKGNRIFAHANDALKDYNGENFEYEYEDSVSEKIQQIRDIKNEGLEVIHIIQRWGLSENEAFEVEAALIDVYQGLTNIQRGHNSDRGVISPDTLNKIFGNKVYIEPSFKYMIIKVKESTINENNGDLYEAVRRSWKLKINNAEKCKYVFAVIDGLVKEVYEVEQWVESNTSGRYEFTGKIASDNIKTDVIGKLIPEEYRKKGSSNPIQYSKN